MCVFAFCLLSRNILWKVFPSLFWNFSFALWNPKVCWVLINVLYLFLSNCEGSGSSLTDSDAWVHSAVSASVTVQVEFIYSWLLDSRARRTLEIMWRDLLILSLRKPGSKDIEWLFFARQYKRGYLVVCLKLTPTSPQLSPGLTLLLHLLYPLYCAMGSLMTKDGMNKWLIVTSWVEADVSDHEQMSLYLSRK